MGALELVSSIDEASPEEREEAIDCWKDEGESEETRVLVTSGVEVEDDEGASVLLLLLSSTSVQIMVVEERGGGFSVLVRFNHDGRRLGLLELSSVVEVVVLVCEVLIEVVVASASNEEELSDKVEELVAVLLVEVELSAKIDSITVPNHRVQESVTLPRTKGEKRRPEKTREGSREGWKERKLTRLFLADFLFRCLTSDYSRSYCILSRIPKPFRPLHPRLRFQRNSARTSLRLNSSESDPELVRVIRFYFCCSYESTSREEEG